MSHATMDDVFDYTGAEELEPFPRAEALLRMCGRLVQRIAPAPDPVPDDYAEAAKDAECVLFDYLWENPGKYTALSDESGSLSYADWNALVGMVSLAIPEKYMGANTVHVSRGAP